MHNRSAWIRIDPATELNDAVAMAAEFVTRARTRPYAWKWVVLSVHTAAPIALAFAAREAKWAQVPENGKAARMHAFAALLRRYENRLDADTFKAAKRLNELRDEFAHFKYDGWSLEVNYAKEACGGGLVVIELFLMKSDRAAVFWPSRAAEQRVVRTLRLIRKELVIGH